MGLGMTIKWLSSGFALVLMAGASLILHDLSNMDMGTLILCSADEGGIKIPDRLCKYYMVNYRLDKDDIEQYNFPRKPPLSGDCL